MDLVHTALRPTMVWFDHPTVTWFCCCALGEQDHFFGSGVQHLDASHLSVLDDMALAICAVHIVVFEHPGTLERRIREIEQLPNDLHLAARSLLALRGVAILLSDDQANPLTDQHVKKTRAHGEASCNLIGWGRGSIEEPSSGV